MLCVTFETQNKSITVGNFLARSVSLLSLERVSMVGPAQTNGAEPSDVGIDVRSTPRLEWPP